jgi:hypothetical protein
MRWFFVQQVCSASYYGKLFVRASLNISLKRSSIVAETINL